MAGYLGVIKWLKLTNKAMQTLCKVQHDFYALPHKRIVKAAIIMGKKSVWSPVKTFKLTAMCKCIKMSLLFYGNFTLFKDFILLKAISRKAHV